MGRVRVPLLAVAVLAVGWLGPSGLNGPVVASAAAGGW
jgi:hypothetical protein